MWAVPSCLNKPKRCMRSQSTAHTSLTWCVYGRTARIITCLYWDSIAQPVGMPRGMALPFDSSLSGVSQCKQPCTSIGPFTGSCGIRATPPRHPSQMSVICSPLQRGDFSDLVTKMLEGRTSIWECLFDLRDARSYIPIAFQSIFSTFFSTFRIPNQVLTPLEKCFENAL